MISDNLKQIHKTWMVSFLPEQEELSAVASQVFL